MTGTARHDELAANLSGMRVDVDAACAAAGRDPADVTLIVVTKFFPASDVEELVSLGVRHIGENRDQEVGPKVADLPEEVRGLLTVHFVGQLQTNKANRVARYADVVQSVDRARLVTALDRGAGIALDEGLRQEPIDVTLQVDLGEGEDRGRGGALPEDLPALADATASAEHLRLRGLMAVAPRDQDEPGVRAAFERLAQLGEDLRKDHPDATWMSAGMSGDFETAVTCGATHLRVGTRIMGSRL
ncbi:YggS family pyridoxal phosphate-dependent enzyme [Ornithinimicrobium avium]|uniref:Pyridoxal phosphate homeostasis protein n=1 Tax=Ornithinimicrobium avium TaxID=2283195 RepID=A0A345NKT7_9MICO|nr:YggS family pyridoxal phosphate-dependent enzyme [Ornithinimicrobium avium]AXH95645.1 YggS family pyridoxal phosphate-dependent enzyme [Ornithinimicrobium avium]